jgi:rhodanese-related sulfurtransferase
MHKSAPPPVVTTAYLSDLIRNDPTIRLLDVRTPGEYSALHIRGAYNVPLGRLSEHASEIRGVTGPVVLVCRSGQRARKAEAALKSAGMPNLHVLEGGMQGWEAAGLPVERGVERLSLERQVRIVAGSVTGVGALLALTMSSLFALVPLVVGVGLAFSGVTDSCGMAMLLARLPYNRPAQCDVGAMVRALCSNPRTDDR